MESGEAFLNPRNESVSVILERIFFCFRCGHGKSISSQQIELLFRLSDLGFSYLVKKSQILKIKGVKRSHVVMKTKRRPWHVKHIFDQ